MMPIHCCTSQQIANQQILQFWSNALSLTYSHVCNKHPEKNLLSWLADTFTIPSESSGPGLDVQERCSFLVSLFTTTEVDLRITKNKHYHHNSLMRAGPQQNINISRRIFWTTSEAFAHVENGYREAGAFSLALIIPQENSQAIC